jgi:hypothetical protein
MAKEAASRTPILKTTDEKFGAQFIKDPAKALKTKGAGPRVYSRRPWSNSALSDSDRISPAKVRIFRFRAARSDETTA